MPNQIETLTVFSVIAAIAASGGFAGCWYLYRDENVPPPLRLIASRITRGRIEEPASHARIMRSIRTKLRSAYVIQAGGTRTACSVLSVYLAPEALEEISRYEVDDLHGQIGRAYARQTLKAGWTRHPQEQLTVYVVADDTRHANHVLVEPRRPLTGDSVGRILDLRTEQFSFTAATGRGTEPGTRKLGDETTTDYGGTTVTSDHLETSETTGPDETEHDREAFTTPDLEHALVTRGGLVVCRVTDSGMKIGRSAEVDLFVDDRSVSRHHATLQSDGGTLVLVPEPGRRCFVNGVLVQGPTMVNPGDTMKFARCPSVFTLQAGDR